MTNQRNEISVVCSRPGLTWFLPYQRVTFLFPQFYVSVDEQPQAGYREKEYNTPSDPWKVLQSECLQWKELVIHFHCKPWFFHCSVSSVFLVVVLERFSHFGVDDVVLGESVSVIFDVHSRGQSAWSAYRTASALALVGCRSGGKTTLEPTEFVNVECFTNESVTKIYGWNFTLLLSLLRGSSWWLAWLLQHHSDTRRSWLWAKNHKHLWTYCCSRWQRLNWETWNFIVGR